LVLIRSGKQRAYSSGYIEGGAWIARSARGYPHSA
jgi:hypothetical protein